MVVDEGIFYEEDTLCFVIDGTRMSVDFLRMFTRGGVEKMQDKLFRIAWDDSIQMPVISTQFKPNEDK